MFQLSVNPNHFNKTVENPKYYRDGFNTEKLTIERLAEVIKRGHAWSCATYNKGKRSKANYQEAQLIALDIDSGLKLQDALDHPFVKKYAILIYTSSSHQKQKGDAPPCDRFRIVFSAYSSIKDMDTYEQLVRAVMGHFGVADEGCKDASRLWAGNTQSEIFMLDGEPLPDSLIDEAKEQARIEFEIREKRRQETLASVKEQNPDEVKALALEALKFIPPRQPGTGTYSESLRVLMSLTTIFGQSEAIAIAESWSPPEKGWNPSRKIQGFREGEVTAGSLFWIAQQYGFKFPQREWHGATEGVPSQEPDEKLYQAYVARLREEEEVNQAIADQNLLDRFNRFVEKTKTKLSKKKTSKLSKINPFGEGETYSGNRAKNLLEVIREGYDVLDNTFMGDGKSHSILEIENEKDRVIYLSKNHRNPSISKIKEKFTDINPRSQWGFYQDEQGNLVEANYLINPDVLVIKPNCVRGDMFKTLKNKGYQVESKGTETNPICKNCPLLGQCSTTEWMYKFERKKVLEGKYLRGHIDSLSRDDNYQNDIIVIDEPTEQLTTTQVITETWEQLVIELDRLRPHLSKEDYSFIDSLAQQTKPLFKDKQSLDLPTEKLRESLRYGVAHDSILSLISIKNKEKLSEIIGQLEELEYEFITELFGKLDRDHILAVEQFKYEPEYQELKKKLSKESQPDSRKELSIKFNQLEFLRAKWTAKIKGVNSIYKSIKNTEYVKEVSDKIDKAPPNGLLYLIKGLFGDSNISLRIRGNIANITINNPDKYAFLKGAKKIYLDATIDPNLLEKLIPSDRPLKVIHRETALPLQNLKITNINTPGLKTNNPTDTAIKRARLVHRKLTNQYGDIPLISHKGISDRLDLDGSWFVQNRGSNAFQGNPNLAFLGTPNPNYGAIQDQYRAIYGTLDNFDCYYDRLIKADILQAVGRQRCQRYPNQNFYLFAITTDLNLDFLRAYGADIKNCHSLEIHEKAGDSTQLARIQLLKAIEEIEQKGATVTRQTQLAQVLGVSRQAVSKLLRNAGVTLPAIVKQVRNALKKVSTRPIKTTNRAGCQDFPLSEFRRFLELDVVAIAKEAIELMRTFTWDDFVEYCLNYYPDAVKARVLGVLWGLLNQASVGEFLESPPD